MNLLQQAGAGAPAKDDEDKNLAGDTSASESESGGSSTLESKMRSLFPDLATDGEEVDTTPKEPLVAFKHKQVKLFQVGDFVFYDGILYIYSEEDLEKFAELYKGLGGPDKINIVAYDWKAAASIESDASTAIRGMLTSKSIKDPKKIG
jgi:hypothetical protein